MSDSGTAPHKTQVLPSAEEEIKAMETTIRAIQSFPKDARCRVLQFAWSWANDKKNQLTQNETN